MSGVQDSRSIAVPLREESSERGLTFWQSLCCRILKCGQIPRHVAFIMDGNRRYAKMKRMERSLGHVLGFDKLAGVSICNVLV
jgi:ditrans,polycis-polyprenyl diphosphate synthase